MYGHYEKIYVVVCCLLGQVIIPQFVHVHKVVVGGVVHTIVYDLSIFNVAGKPVHFLYLFMGDSHPTMYLIW